MDLANKLMNSEMETSKNKAKELMESWDLQKTAKPSKSSGSFQDGGDLKQKLLLESYKDFYEMSDSELREYLDLEDDSEIDSEEMVEMAVEKSKTDHQSVHISENSKKLSLGVYEIIKDLKESSLSKQHSFKLMLDQFDFALRERNIPETAIIENLSNSLADYKWDSGVKRKIDQISEILESKKYEIEADRLMNSLRRDASWSFYDEPIRILESWILDKSENKSERLLTNSLKKWSFNPGVSHFINRVNEMSSRGTKSLSIPAKQGESYVSKVFSPVRIFEGKTNFYLDGSFYEATQENLKKVQRDSLSEEFLDFVKAFENENLRVSDNGATFYLGKDKVRIDSGDLRNHVYLNESELRFRSVQDLFKLLETKFNRSMGSNVKSSTISDIIRIYENIEDLVELDFSKSVNSRIHEGLKVNLIKWNNRIYLNKINPMMRENSLYESTGRKTIKFVKDFLNYDITEGLTEFLDGEDRVRSIMINDLNKILENINVIEDQIKKIDRAAIERPSISESSQIKEAKRSLEFELASLRRKWNLVNEEIKSLDDIDFSELENLEESGNFSIGDLVKIKESGDTGKVISIDGTSGVYTVLHDSGKTGDYRIDEISDLETALKQASSDNEESVDEPDYGSEESGEEKI